MDVPILRFDPNQRAGGRRIAPSVPALQGFSARAGTRKLGQSLNTFKRFREKGDNKNVEENPLGFDVLMACEAITLTHTGYPFRGRGLGLRAER